VHLFIMIINWMKIEKLTLRNIKRLWKTYLSVLGYIKTEVEQ